MNHDGKPALLAEFIDAHHPRIHGINVLIDRSEFYPGQLQGHDLFECFIDGIDPWIDGSESDDFFRVAGGIARQICIGNRQPRMMCPHPKDDSFVDPSHGSEVPLRWYMEIQAMPAGTGVRFVYKIIGEVAGVSPDMRMTVN